jgi:2-(1,2-epoxy-1,2-dihydrophenyl)acetyl-CoA isomerase
MSAGALVDYRVRDGVAWITLNRPDKLNALVGDMREVVLEHVHTAAGDDGVRALVVTGAGRAFCAGGDIDNMIRLRADGDEAGFRRLLHAGNEVMLALQAFPGLTVAAVNGVAAGAGLSLSLSCDLRLVSPDARFAAPWIKLGLVPDWGASFWLPRLIGCGRALEMVLTGAPVAAREAARIGLVTEVIEDDDFAAAVQRRAAAIGAPGLAVAHAKRLVRLGAEDSMEAALARESEAQEVCFESDDFKEGLDAFVAKRKAEFKGS